MSSAAELTPNSPFGRRLAAYLRERFPLLAHGILIVSYYSSNQFLAQLLADPGEPVSYSGGSAAGAWIVFGVFFHLRVFDEHKDYADDVRLHPERILSRGIITLRELRILAGLVIASALIIAALRSPNALVAYGLVLGFSLLMRVEFFVGRWLRRRFFLYAISHLAIMPLLALFVWSFTTGRAPWEAPLLFHLYAWVGFFVTFNWEVSRKIRAPDEEHPEIVTYSGRLGYRGAAAFVLVLRAVDTLLVAIVGWALALGTGFHWAIVLLYVVTWRSARRFMRRPTSVNARRLEKVAGSYIIAFDLILAVAILWKVGLTW